MAGPLIEITRVDGSGRPFLLHQVDLERVMATGRYKVLRRGLEIVKEDGTVVPGAPAAPAASAAPVVEPAAPAAPARPAKPFLTPRKLSEDKE